MKRERETDLKSKDEGKEDHGHSQQIKLGNFTVNLWYKRKKVLYPISIAMEACSIKHVFKSRQLEIVESWKITLGFWGNNVICHTFKATLPCKAHAWKKQEQLVQASYVQCCLLSPKETFFPSLRIQIDKYHTIRFQNQEGTCGKMV